jgi:hypothetical protein
VGIDDDSVDVDEFFALFQTGDVSAPGLVAIVTQPIA